jgi:hypothetical protein
VGVAARQQDEEAGDDADDAIDGHVAISLMRG